MRIHIHSMIRSYTGNRGTLDIEGTTLRELLDNMERAHPGIRFRIIDEQDRIRQHVNIFVGKDKVHTIDVPLAGADAVHVLASLSGG